MGLGLKIAAVCLLIIVIAIGLLLCTSVRTIDSSREEDSAEAKNSANKINSSEEVISMKEQGNQNMASFTSNLIMPGVWEITDGTAASPSFVDIYLVAGSNKALVIDAGASGSDLASYIRTLTDKPVELVLTHGHGDHIAATAQFKKVYMSSRDFNLIKPHTPFKDFKASGIKDLQGGEVFDLGGCKLEILALPGHTPGSIVLLDRERQLLFAGDALGSGSLWMQLPESSSVEEFRDEIRKFEKFMEGLNDLKPYLGHSCLMAQKPDRNYITDTRIAAEKIVSGEITGVPSGRADYPGSITASYGQMMDFLYRPEKVLKGRNK